MGWQRMKWLDSITDSMVMNLKILWETVKERRALPTAVHGVAETEHLNSNNNKPRLPAIWRHRLMEKTPREALLCSSVAVLCSRRHFLSIFPGSGACHFFLMWLMTSGML